MRGVLFHNLKVSRVTAKLIQVKRRPVEKFEDGSRLRGPLIRKRRE
jgi:hypothetical protein